MKTAPMVWANDPRRDAVKRCVCCGKPLRGRWRWVEVINGGSAVIHPSETADQNDGGYMGFFPVGATCAKKLFNGFTHPQDTISI